MKYIPVHIGDWVKNTHTLTAAEEGIYWRACVWCYQHEKPLPLVFKDVCKELHAHDTSSREALRSVLDRFFTLTENGFINHRVQKVISHTAQKSGTETEQDQRQYHRARQARHSQRRKLMHKTLENSGVIAPFDATTSHLESLLITHGLVDKFSELASADASADGHVTPSRARFVNCEPMNQDVTLSRYGADPRAPDLADRLETAQTADPSTPSQTETVSQQPAPADPAQQPTETVTPTPAAAAARAMKAAGLQAVNPSHPDLLRLVAAGATTEELRYAAAEAVARGKPFGYALAIVEGRRKDAAAKGDVPPARDAMSRWAPTLRKGPPQ